MAAVAPLSPPLLCNHLVPLLLLLLHHCCHAAVAPLSPGLPKPGSTIAWKTCYCKAADE
jgi:hypothetical protein